MIARLKSSWSAVNASYWFYPGLFALASLVLALVTVRLDRLGRTDWLESVSWLYSARPEGAANMLTVIAGSMIGVASTVFSITIAAVAYASGNYGPRLLTNFMENKGNQFSLATFIGTFVYAITVLREVRMGETADFLDTAASTSPAFVPQFSLLIAYILMALSVAVLVYFLNHVPASIRINTVLQGIGERLITEIKAFYNRPARGETQEHVREGRPVIGQRTGYIQVIDFDRLDRIAERIGGHITLERRTGDFVHPGIAIAYWERDDELEEFPDDQVRDCFALGGMRTPSQDLHFLIDELAEIGLRALSPGINDPFTAITALHWLGAAMAELGTRDLRRSFNGAEDAEEDRVVLRDTDYAHFVRRGFGTMRSALATSPTAARVAFDVLANASVTLDDENRHRVLVVEGEQLMRQSREVLVGPDLEMVEARYQFFRERMCS